jgi:hypothetical protein
MRENRALYLAGYALALTLVLIPLSEAALAVFPPRPLATEWRVGSIGIFTEALMTPVLGLAIAVVVARVSGHPRAFRALGGLSAILAGLLVISAGVFTLDSLKTRPQVRPEALTTFNAATLQALMKMVLSGAVLGLLGAGALMDDSGPGDGEG